MADSNEQWPTILDEQSFSYLVELSQNLSKVEGLVDKLVKGEYQQWYKKNYESGQDSQNYSVENISWDAYADSKSEAENNDKSTDWYATGDGEQSNEKNNNIKNKWTGRWDDGWDIEPDWSSAKTKNETAFNWDTTKVSEWETANLESEMRDSDSKKSNQEKIDQWESSGSSDW